MISKLSLSFGFTTIVSSVNAIDIDRNFIDSRSTSFDSSMGCATCILSGYTFMYDTAETDSLSYDPKSSAYSAVNKCCETTDCDGNPTSKLLSSHFKSNDAAINNCPSLTDLCGAKQIFLTGIAATPVTRQVGAGSRKMMGSD